MLMTIKSIKSVARFKKAKNKNIVYDVIGDDEVINQKSLAKKKSSKNGQVSKFGKA